MKSFHLSLLLSALIFSANAETYRLAFSEASHGRSNCWGRVENWTTDGKWGSPSPTSFSSADEFIVPAKSTGYTLRTTVSTAAEARWTGKLLRIGGEWSKTYHLAVLRQMTRGQNAPLVFENDGLFLSSNSCYYPYYSNGDVNRVKGHVTIESTSADYAAQIFAQFSTNTCCAIEDDFNGAVGTFAKIMSGNGLFTVTLSDTRSFYGTLMVTNHVEGSTAKLILGSDFPGNLMLDGASTLEIAAGSKISRLDLAAGSAIDATEGAFCITNEFVHDGVVKVVVAQCAQSETWQTLLILPSGTEVSADDFDFVLEDGSPLFFDEIRVLSDAEGVSVQVLNLPIVTLTKGDGTKRTAFTSSAMTNAACWSDGELPTNVLKKYQTNGYNLRTCDSSTSVKSPSDDFTFAGYSLIVDDSCLVIDNLSFNARKMVLRDGASVLLSLYCAGTVYAPMVCESGEISFSTYSSYVGWTIAGEISGIGNLTFYAASGTSTSQPYGTFTLRGTNTSFAGTMKVTIPVNDVSDYKKCTPSFNRNYTTLRLTDKRNLGGPLSELNRKALTLENMSVLNLSDDTSTLTLDEPTRGIFVNSCARFAPAAGQMLTIASPLAFNGTLWKQGGGELVLANPSPTFGSEATETDPTELSEDRHLLMIECGEVEIASADALNGVVVAASNATQRLVLDAASANADLKAYGIRNVKTSGPFYPQGDLSRLTIALKASSPLAGETATVAVTTVPTEEAAGVASSINVVVDDSLFGWHVVGDLTQDAVTVGETACVTLKANLKRAGMTLLLR